MIEENFQSSDGLKIYSRSFPPAGDARGVLVIVPGFNSHSGYYQWTAEQLNASGLAVYAVDLRGRGKSAGERFYVQSFNDYVSDVHSLVQLAKARHPGLPVYLLGHSAGGVVACLYAIDHAAELSGLICMSFAFQVPAPDVALSLLKGLSKLAPHAHVLKLKNEDFSRDPKAVAAMNADPLIAHEVQPTQTVAEMVRADERLKQAFSRITTPLFILHGGADRATKPSGSQFFHDNAGAEDKTLKIYQGYYHFMLGDVGKETVLADIRDWIVSRLTKREARRVSPTQPRA
jgi:alpha-beta hydrolase superfamily lysophospholipase